MSNISGNVSIALASRIFNNKEYFNLKDDNFKKINKLFDEALRKNIKNFKDESSESLLTSLRQDENIKTKITNMEQKGEFFSTEDILPAFQNILDKDITSKNIEDICEQLNIAITSDHTLNEELKNIYLQIIVKSEKWDLALEYYNNSLAAFESSEDKHNVAKTYNDIGNIYQAKGEWNKAIGNYSKALETFEFLGDHNGMAQGFGNLGIVHQAKNELDKAIEYYNQSLESFEKGGDNYGKALTFNNLGLAFQDKGDLQKADNLYKKSWEIFETDGDLQGMAQSRGNLSMLAFANKNPKKAIKQFFEILFLYIKMEAKEQVNQAFSIIRYFTNQMESDQVKEIFKSVQEELSKDGITWGKHNILNADDVKQIYATLNRQKTT